MKRIGVLLYPGCIFFEIALATETLARSGCALWWVSPDGDGHAASNGARLAVDGNYDSLAARPLDAVLIPGGDPGSIFHPGRADECLRAAHAQGACMAGICAGALVLAHAGLLRGRRVTHNYTPQYASPEAVATTAPLWEGIEYDGRDVVVDGAFITAMPWAYAGFTAALMQQLGVFDAGQAQRFAAYHSCALQPVQGAVP